MTGVMVLSGYILGLFLLFLGGVVVVFGEAIWNSGITIIYVILYKLQENESLLEREDEELLEEDEQEAVPSEESGEEDEPEPEEKPEKTGPENKSKGKPPEKS
jgi:hypothetical protein